MGTCLSIKISSVGKSVPCSLTRGVAPFVVGIKPATKRVDVTAFNPAGILAPKIADARKRLKIRCDAVCSVGASAEGYEVFAITNGILVMFDGKEFSVLKRKWQ